MVLLGCGSHASQRRKRQAGRVSRDRAGAGRSGLVRPVDPFNFWGSLPRLKEGPWGPSLSKPLWLIPFWGKKGEFTSRFSGDGGTIWIFNGHLGDDNPYVNNGGYKNPHCLNGLNPRVGSNATHGVSTAPQKDAHTQPLGPMMGLPLSWQTVHILWQFNQPSSKRACCCDFGFHHNGKGGLFRFHDRSPSEK